MSTGLNDVISVAARGHQSLALRQDGTVVGWDNNAHGQCEAPADLTNAMAIAAGYAHSVALRNDGTMVCWGDNAHGQTNAVDLVQVKLIAAGRNHTLASVFNPLVQYPVDVSKDLLLIYNATSSNSVLVKDYYLAHRPMVSDANVLGINCVTNETALHEEYANQIAAPVLEWLTANPTKHPLFVVLFLDIPTRVNTNRAQAYPPTHPSVSVGIHDIYPGSKPVVTHLNMGDTNGCKAYIDKLQAFGAEYSAGKLFIAASSGGYANTNYYLDDIREDITTNYTSIRLASDATNALAGLGVGNGALHYVTNWAPHLRYCANLAGYFSWGAHGGLHGYPLNTDVLAFDGAAAWFLIETLESYNGRIPEPWMGTYVQWFSENAFGGSNYSNTPVGAVAHVDEPRADSVNVPAVFFGSWESGRPFGACAWLSRKTDYMMAVGDPFVKR